jgi:hypothetical protein
MLHVTFHPPHLVLEEKSAKSKYTLSREMEESLDFLKYLQMTKLPAGV